MHIFILIAISLSLYGPTMRNGFVTDDNMQILRNAQVKDLQHLPDAFLGDVWSFAEQKNISAHGGTNYYRPLQILVYAGEYAAFGERPWAWHLVNMALNAATVIMVYLLAAALSDPRLGFWAAAWFALHPIHTEAVVWIAALPELQCALFLMAAMLLYHRARSGVYPRWYSLMSAICFACALLTKETALLFPVILAAYECLYRGVRAGELKQRMLWILPSLGTLAAYLALRIAALGGFAPNLEAGRGRLGLWELCLAIPPVLVRYAGKLIAPVGLTYFYSFPLATKLSLASLACFALITISGVAVVLLSKKHPLLAFSMAWFLLTLAPALSLNSIGENFFTERYLYIPSMGFSIVAAWAWLRLMRIRETKVAKMLAGSAAAAVFVFYAAQIERRIPAFRDNFTLWSITVKQSPNAFNVQAGLAAAYYERGDLNGALDHGLKAIALNPNYIIGRINLASYLSDKGRYEESIEQLKAAIQLYPEYLPPWINLAKVYTMKHAWKEARECYLRAAALDTAGPRYFQQLAAVTEAAERNDAMLEELRTQVSRKPGDPGALARLGDGYAQRGDWKAAIDIFQMTSKLKPVNPVLLTKLGMCLEKTGDFAGAISAFEVALKTQPDALLTRQSLASALAAAGRTAESNAELQYILEINPRWEHSDQVYLEMGLNSEKAGNRSAAVRQYQQALAVNPQLSLAQKRLAELSAASGQTSSNGAVH